jgi:hypothetical protein
MFPEFDVLLQQRRVAGPIKIYPSSYRLIHENEGRPLKRSGSRASRDGNNKKKK